MKIITGQSLYLLYGARYTKEQCIIESTHTWKFALLYSKQFGFRSKHSTIEAVVELTEKIRLKNSFKERLIVFSLI